LQNIGNIGIDFCSKAKVKRRCATLTISKSIFFPNGDSSMPLTQWDSICRFRIVFFTHRVSGTDDRGYLRGEGCFLYLWRWGGVVTGRVTLMRALFLR